MRQHILRSHMFEKIRTRNEPGRLIACPAEQKRFACFMQTVGKLLKSMDASCIKRCHIAKTQNHYISKRCQILGGFRELLSRSEEKRSMNAENGYVRGDVLVLQDVRLPIL